METVPSGAAEADDPATIIEKQREEIARLQRRISEDRFAQDLRDAMTAASATGIIAAPISYRRLLTLIVTTAADIIDARAASLFLTDANQEHLVFEVAVGEQVVESTGFRIPLGHGVAGLVAQTGQPMALSDSPADDIDAEDLGHAVGFNPKNVLCVPLAFEDQVFGVLQFLDKEDEEAFSVDDMEAIGLYAHLAMIAIEQSRTEHRMSVVMAELVGNLDGLPDIDRDGLTARARKFTADLGQQTGYVSALQLARLVQEITLHGDSASEACRGILENFAEYLRVRSRGGPAERLGRLAW